MLVFTLRRRRLAPPRDLLPTPRRAVPRRRAETERHGWGQRAMFALANNSELELRAAAADEGAGEGELGLAARVNLQVIHYINMT